MQPAISARLRDRKVKNIERTKPDVVAAGNIGCITQIAAGTAFGQWPGGIAPGADLVSARIISDEPPTDDSSGNGNQVEASDAAFFAQTLHPDLIAAGVQVGNGCGATVNQAGSGNVAAFVQTCP